MDYTPTTELEAVNSIIATIGEAPVNTLVGTLPNEVVIARNALHEKNREVQLTGRHFNTELKYPLSPDPSTGKIALPTNTLSVDLPTGLYPTLDVVQRGQYLYNKTDRTYVFDSTLKATLVLFLAFTELPEYARNYIKVLAGRTFQKRIQGSQVLYQITHDDELRAKADFMRCELNNSDTHYLMSTTVSEASIRRSVG